MIKQYTKKPVTINAVQWDGTNYEEIGQFVGESFRGMVDMNVACLGIQTLEGLMRASLGDYIIRGVSGEFYPCKPDIFGLTYSES